MALQLGKVRQMKEPRGSLAPPVNSLAVASLPTSDAYALDPGSSLCGSKRWEERGGREERREKKNDWETRNIAGDLPFAGDLSEHTAQGFISLCGTGRWWWTHLDGFCGTVLVVQPGLGLLQDGNRMGCCPHGSIAFCGAEVGGSICCLPGLNPGSLPVFLRLDSIQASPSKHSSHPRAPALTAMSGSDWKVVIRMARNSVSSTRLPRTILFGVQGQSGLARGLEGWGRPGCRVGPGCPGGSWLGSRVV
jgi:hypothetical protein